MTLSLRQILKYPIVTTALPHVLAGSQNLDRQVRWVHSSEVIQIAPLLQGGELLLTGGTALAESSERDREHYIADLVERAVSGIAIETGTALAVVPPDIVAEAVRLEFPLIELRRVVPFVAVTEAINSDIAEQSVANLRFVAELAHELSRVVGEGGQIRDVLTAIAACTNGDAVLYDAGGTMIEAVGDAPPVRLPHPNLAESDDVSPSGITVDVAVRRTPVATLWLETIPADDAERMKLVSRTAAEFLSLALVRVRPPSARDLAVGQLVRLAGADAVDATQLQNVARMISFPLDRPVIGVVATGIGSAEIARILGSFGRVALDTPSPTDTRALVSLEDRLDAVSIRAAIVETLRCSKSARQAQVIAVGPVVPALTRAPLSLRAAMDVAGREGDLVGSRGVIDTHDLVVDRLATGEGKREQVLALVDEEFAMFDPLPSKIRSSLLDTLEAYFDSGCDKSVTAKRLRVSRQALYGRLARAFAILGGDPTGTRRALDLHIALRIRHTQ
ncbi:MAG: PucR family transcriptional regulator [Microbacteriaceae bacterium]|nr:MAG: PucR family transcriptional regulator [Microbacteriaceae bacterium]